MRYEEFRRSLTDALIEARVPFVGVRSEETIDVATTNRHCKMYLGRAMAQRAEPFGVTASIAFDWRPVESARTYTTEDDLVTALFGRDEEPMDTMPRSLRIDFVLHASLPYGTRAPMPRAGLWRSWSSSVYQRLADTLPTEAPEHLGRLFLVTGWGGTVTVKSECSPTGELSLRSVSLPTWQSVVLPRVLDGDDEDSDVDIVLQLDTLAERYRDALDEWMDWIAELREGSISAIVHDYLRLRVGTESRISSDFQK